MYWFVHWSTHSVRYLISLTYLQPGLSPQLEEPQYVVGAEVTALATKIQVRENDTFIVSVRETDCPECNLHPPISTHLT